MLKVKLFQQDLETIFWTYDEIKIITNNDYNFKIKNDYKFILHNIEFEIHTEDKFENIKDKFSKDVLNVCVFKPGVNSDIDLIKFKSIFSEDCNFLLVYKNIEDYWLCGKESQKDIFDYIKNSDHIKVISDYSELNVKNFFFEPKIHLQNYYNQEFSFPSTLFLYGNEIFHHYDKKERIGIHYNKVVEKYRERVVNRLHELNKNNLFFTVNSENYINIQNKIKTNYKSKIPNIKIYKHGLPYDSYIDSFYSLNLKSQMEFIYETYTTNGFDIDTIKFTEKTLKLLYLSKPFIHTDPIAHNLLKKNNLDSYQSIMNDNLLKFYENFSTKINLRDSIIDFTDIIIENIIWLQEMEESEWKKRIEIANTIARRNREKILNYIFNTSLLEHIQKYQSKII